MIRALVSVLFAVQQQPTIPEGFVPVTGAPVTEQIPAAPLVIGAYATVWLSIYFPVLVLFRRLRLPTVLAMSGFHASIAVLMGLTSFALVMIACAGLSITALAPFSRSPS